MTCGCSGTIGADMSTATEGHPKSEVVAHDHGHLGAVLAHEHFLGRHAHQHEHGQAASLR